MRVVLDSGEVLDLGETEATPTIGIVDYSRRVTDDYGVTTVVERGFARRMSVNLVVPFDQTDALQRNLAAIRAKPARWIADEGVDWLDFRGFYKDFEVNLPVPPKAYCTMTVEALTATEAFADPGGDPAPLGLASTLQLLQPATIEGGALVASTVPENDYPEWAAGTTYPLGARVIKAATHRIYESGSIGNVGNDPTGTSGKWQDIGPTNRWAMFDQALGSTTEAPGQITVSLAPGAANAVALLDVKAATVRVVTTGYDRTLVPNASGTVTFLDLPGTDGQVTVVITGPGTVEVGTLLVGKLVGLGSTTEDAKAGITDFSRKEADEFGDIQIVERAWAKRMTLPAKLRRDAIDLVAGRIAAVRAKPSLWIGKEGMETLTVYGFLKDFSIAVDSTICTLSLSIEGLSTAGKVEPLTASVDWSDVGDPDGTKPDDNATRNINRGEWAAGIAYEVGDFVQYQGSSYTVTIAHTSVAGTPPPNANMVLMAAQGGKGDKGDKGDTGGAGLPGQTATLSPASQMVWAYANGNVKDYNGLATQVTVFQGNSNVSPDFTISVASNPQALTYSISGRVVTITGAGTAAGNFGNNAVTNATLTLRATGTGASAGRVYDLVFALGKLTGGYEIVTSNPTTGNFEGRQVYNSTAGKLYTYTSGQWRATVNDATVLADAQIGGMSATKLVGTVDSSKLGVGLGGNMLAGAVPGTRPDLYMVRTQSNISGAVYGTNQWGEILTPITGANGWPGGSGPSAQWTPPDLSGFAVYQSNDAASNPEPDWFGFRKMTDTVGNWTLNFPVQPGKRYEFSLYTGAHRCRMQVGMAFVNAAGTWLGQAGFGEIPAQDTNNVEQNGGALLSGYKRIYCRGTAPAGTVGVQVYMRKYGTNPGNTANPKSYAFMCYPMLGETTANATELLPYSQPSMGIIVAQHIYSNSITSAEISANAIGTEELAARSVIATKMTMMDFENLMVDGDLASGTLSAYSRSYNGVGGISINIEDGGAGTSWPSRYALRIMRNGNTANEATIVNGVESFDSNSGIYGIAVKPGDEFGFECISWASEGQVGFDFIMRNSAGSLEWLLPVAVENTAYESTTSRLVAFPGQNFRVLKGIFKYTGTSQGKAFLRIHGGGPSTPNAYCYFWNMKMRRRNAAMFTVDGSISALQIAANSIDSDRLQAGAVIAGKVAANAITAINIQAQTIVASKFVTDQGVDLAALVPGSINWRTGSGGSYSVSGSNIDTSFIYGTAGGTISGSAIISFNGAATRSNVAPGYGSSSWTMRQEYYYSFNGGPWTYTGCFATNNGSQAGLTQFYGTDGMAIQNGPAKWTTPPGAGSIAFCMRLTGIGAGGSGHTATISSPSMNAEVVNWK